MKIQPVRVTNPADVSTMLVEPGKAVGGFVAGTVFGNFALTPLLDAIDDRFDGVMAGVIKLGVASVALGGLAVAGEKMKAKPGAKNAPVVAAASLGFVSPLAIAGLRDLTGRGASTSAQVIDVEVEEATAPSQQQPKAMSGTVIDLSQFPPKETTPAEATMFGTRSFGESSFSTRSFGSFA